MEPAIPGYFTPGAGLQPWGSLYIGSMGVLSSTRTLLTRYGTVSALLHIRNAGSQDQRGLQLCSWCTHPVNLIHLEFGIYAERRGLLHESICNI